MNAARQCIQYRIKVLLIAPVAVASVERVKIFENLKGLKIFQNF